jgi:hypothetical protein
MNQIEALAKAFAEFVQLPWSRTVVGAQRVWFAVYDPAQERRLRLRLTEFEIATKEAGHQWVEIDITNAFAEWMATQDYRDTYFEDPEALLDLPEFTIYLTQRIIDALQQPGVDNNTVVAVIGLATLFGLVSASEVFEKVTPTIQGRLLVFFPGQREGSNYRLLDARDGWNYLAIPITAAER